MELIRRIETLLVRECDGAKELSSEFYLPPSALAIVPKDPCMDHLAGSFSDAAKHFTRYRQDVHMDSEAYLRRWLRVLRAKMEARDQSEGELRSLVFDHVWAVCAYASDVRNSGDRSTGIRAFREAFDIAKNWPNSWCFAAVLRRLPAFLDQERDELALGLLLHCQEIFRVVGDPIQTGYTMASIATLRSRRSEWELCARYGREMVRLTDNVLKGSPEGDDLRSHLRRLGYIHQAAAQLQLGNFLALKKILSAIPQLPGVVGHDLILVGLFRAAMHWDLGEVGAARGTYRREMERVTVQFPDLRVYVGLYWAFMEAEIGEAAKSAELVAAGVADEEGFPVFRSALVDIQEGRRSFHEAARHILETGAAPGLTPPNILELSQAA